MYRKVEEPHKYYKRHHFIRFYDMDGENCLYTFNNVREILRFMGEETSRTNVNIMNVRILRAAKSEKPSRILSAIQSDKSVDERRMRTYIIDNDEENC